MDRLSDLAHNEMDDVEEEERIEKLNALRKNLKTEIKDNADNN